MSNTNTTVPIADADEAEGFAQILEHAGPPPERFNIGALAIAIGNAIRDIATWDEDSGDEAEAEMLAHTLAGLSNAWLILTGQGDRSRPGTDLMTLVDAQTVAVAVTASQRDGEYVARYEQGLTLEG